MSGCFADRAAHNQNKPSGRCRAAKWGSLQTRGVPLDPLFGSITFTFTASRRGRRLRTRGSAPLGTPLRSRLGLVILLERGWRLVAVTGQDDLPGSGQQESHELFRGFLPIRFRHNSQFLIDGFVQGFVNLDDLPRFMQHQ